MTDETVVIVPYQSGRALGRTVQVLLALFLLGALPQVGLNLATIPLWESALSSAQSGGAQALENAEKTLRAAVEISVLGTNVKQVTAFIGFAVVIAFLVWLLRVHENLPALGLRKLTYSSAWVLGWWFIPFLNLFMPYKVVTEIWVGSDPDNDVTEVAEAGESPALVGWWWATLAPAVILLFYFGPAVDELNVTVQGRIYLDAAAQVLIIVGGLLGLNVVGRISAMQDRKAALRGL